MLDTHLNSIYLTESINNDLNKVKTNAKKINDSLQSADVLKIDRSTLFLKGMSEEELGNFTKKKYHLEYTENEKYIIKKIKKSPKSIQNLLITFRTGIAVIKKMTNDPDILNETHKSLVRIDKALDVIKKNSKKEGLTTLGAALAIQNLLMSSLFITATLLVKGKFALVGACVITSLSLLIHNFVNAKKERKKVIN